MTAGEIRLPMYLLTAMLRNDLPFPSKPLEPTGLTVLSALMAHTFIVP